MAWVERSVATSNSGAETPTSSLKGLRVYSGDCERLPQEVLPLSGTRYWTRRGVAEWLVTAYHGSLGAVEFGGDNIRVNLNGQRRYSAQGEDHEGGRSVSLRCACH